MTMFIFNHKTYGCPFDTFIDVLRGKWRSTILLELRHGPINFNALQRAVTGISAKVLMENLRPLEEAGIILRIVESTVPPTVSYELTPMGLELINVMDRINHWSNTYLSEN